jgi:hypothetical protein
MNEAVAGEKDYTRFSMPPVRGVDPSVRDEEGKYETERVRELAPFLYRGESPWPFKYRITTGET